MPEHGRTHIQCNEALALDHGPRQGQRTKAMGERAPLHLQAVAIHKAAIEDDGHIPMGPCLEDMGDDGFVHGLCIQVGVLEPAAHLGHARDRIRCIGNMVGNQTEVDRLCLDDSNHDPHPIGQPSMVEMGMKLFQPVEQFAV